MSDDGSVNCLAGATVFQSVSFRKTNADIVWLAEDGQFYSLKLPLIEACKLLDYLQQAPTRLQGAVNIHPECSNFSDNIDLVSKLRPCKTLHGISNYGIYIKIQWATTIREWNELTTNSAEAMRLKVLIENALPIGRSPTDDVSIQFDNPVSVNDLTQIWRPAYRADRYLAKLTEDELRQRTLDVWSNTIQLGTDRKYRPNIVKDETQFYVSDRGIDWLRLLSDIHCEIELRTEHINLEPKPNDKNYLAQRLADEYWC